MDNLRGSVALVLICLTSSNAVGQDRFLIGGATVPQNGVIPLYLVSDYVDYRLALQGKDARIAALRIRQTIASQDIASLQTKADQYVSDVRETEVRILKDALVPEVRAFVHADETIQRYSNSSFPGLAGCGKKQIPAVTQRDQASSIYTCEATINNRVTYSATFPRNSEFLRIIR